MESSWPKMFDLLIGQLREHLNEIRGIEKSVMQICVRDAGMRARTSSTFRATDQPALARQARARQRKHSAALGRLREDIGASRPVARNRGPHAPVDRRDQGDNREIGSARRRRAGAKKEMVEANLRLVISIARSTRTAACSSST